MPLLLHKAGAMIVADEKLYWDRAAADSNVARKYIADVDVQPCLDQIMPSLQPTSILEIGCGIGRLTTAIAALRPDCQVHGIDISPKMLNLAPKSSVTYRVNNGRTIPYPDRSFDSVYSMLVFQHIPDAAKVSYINEAYRVLKPAGVLRLQFVEGNYQGLIDHNTTTDNMLFWLEAAGFEVTSIDPAKLHPLWTWLTAVKP